MESPIDCRTSYEQPPTNNPTILTTMDEQRSIIGRRSRKVQSGPPCPGEHSGQRTSSSLDHRIETERRGCSGINGIPQRYVPAIITLHVPPSARTRRPASTTNSKSTTRASRTRQRTSAPKTLKGRAKDWFAANTLPRAACESVALWTIALKAAFLSG
jgi:hypothetical protein